MLLPANDLALVRSRPHQTELYLSIYKPRTLFAAKVNNVDADVGDREIEFDTVTTGSWSAIVPNTTLYVGTTDGGKDKGSVRVRSATGAYVLVAENSHIDWEDNDFIMVKDFHEIWSVFPIIVASGETIVEYKDFDIPYTDQNTVQGSLICMGGNYAGFLDDPVFYSATGTHNVKGDNLTYAWTFEGAVSGSSTALTPGNVYYDAPGFYTTKLVVTSNSGAVETSYRHISIYAGIGETYKKWAIEELSGSRSQGGYAAKIAIRDDISDIEEGALVVIFGSSWYGATEQNLGGNGLNRASIFFSGYVIDGTIDFDYRDNFVSFEVGSPSEVMKYKETFGISLESVGTAAYWYEMDNLTVEKGIWELVSWNSTIGEVMDCQFLGSDVQTEYFDTDRLPLDGALNQVLENTIAGQAVCDRQGKLWMERKVESVVSAKTNINTIMPINKEDWAGTPSIEERRLNPFSYLEVGGIVYSSVTGSSLLYLSASPGEAPAYEGKPDSIPGLSVSSKANLLEITGDIFAHRNRKYPSIDMDMSGNYSVLDIAPVRSIDYYLLASDNPQKITFDGDKFTIEAMGWSYFPEQKSLSATLGISEVTEGFSATEIQFPIPPELNIPEIPPLDLEILDLEFPTFPPIYTNPGELNPTEPTLPECDDELENGPFNIYITGIMTSADFESKKAYLPEWYFKDGAAPTSYSITAQFQKYVGGVWVDTLDDDFYTVYAVDAAGIRVAEAIKDPLGDLAGVRTGKFSNIAAPIEIRSLEIDMDWDVLRPASITQTVENTIGASGNWANRGNFNWHIYRNGIRVTLTGARTPTSSGFMISKRMIFNYIPSVGDNFCNKNYQVFGSWVFDKFGPGTFSPEPTEKGVSSASHEFWTNGVFSSINSDPMTGKVSGIEYFSICGGAEQLNWMIFPRLSGASNSYVICSFDVIIYPIATYRIVFQKVNLFNVCQD